MISILAHVKMPPPFGQLCAFDMLGRLGSTIGVDFTLVLFALLFATSLQDIHVESWIPRILLISAFLNYAYKSRFDTKSMERSFLEAVRESLFSLPLTYIITIIIMMQGLRLKRRGNLKVRAEDCLRKLPFFLPCPSRLAPLIAPTSSLKRFADIPTSANTSVDVWYDPSSQPPTGAKGGRPVFLYYHGGAWLFGSKRFNHCAVLFWLLARQGFVVVSARYRFAPRVSWNEMFQDALNALDWIESYDQDTKEHRINNRMLRDLCGVTKKSKLFIGGSSAGAHICSCVLSYAMSHPESYDPNMFSGTVLYYPPLDIKNISKTQIEFPLTFNPLNVRRGQCLMLWFWYVVHIRGGILTLTHITHLQGSLSSTIQR